MRQELLSPAFLHPPMRSGVQTLAPLGAETMAPCGPAAAARSGLDALADRYHFGVPGVRILTRGSAGASATDNPRRHHFHTRKARMRLYYNPFSTSARRAVMAAVHLGTPVEMHLVTNMLDPVERKELLRVNPNAKVPVLVDGDFVLWESYAIMQYLAEQTPGQTVYPAALRERLDVNRWLFWCAQHWSPALGLLNWENVIKPFIGMGAPDPQAAARGLAETTRVLEVLDGHLAGRQWVCGPVLSLADFAIATPLMNAGPAGVPLARFPRVEAWFARVQALPAWQKTQPTPP